jgi:Mrp family chromosome partitioning ATPase
MDFTVPQNTGAKIKKIIGIVSGKGGVGKSMVTGLAAVSAMRAGMNVGIMDADITGPSIPRMFGLNERLRGTETSIYPAITGEGIKVVSSNLILDDPEAPVVWRGPVIAGLVKQFYSDVEWEDLDVLFVDMPPGTGDVPLTVFQSLPVDGILVVTSPQDLVAMIVGKALKMAELMNIPVLGLIENMSYVACPHCGEKIAVFGESHIEDIAAKYNVPVIAQLPIDQNLVPAADQGMLEAFKGDFMEAFGAAIANLIK